MLRYFFMIISFTYATGNIAQELPRVLLFTKTAGFRHDNIEKGVAALKLLGDSNGIAVEHTEDASIFEDKQLERYQAIIFFSTTGDIFNDTQKAAFVRYIQSGNGFVGIHAASDTEHNWPWYGAMIGAYFMSHPEIQTADLHIKDHQHPATRHLPAVWTRKDEWYDFKNLSAQVHVLMTIDEGTYKGGKMGSYHPMSWYHEYDGGRAFYTALGHTNESFDEPNFLLHILGGIRYAIGLDAKVAP